MECSYHLGFLIVLGKLVSHLIAVAVEQLMSGDRRPAEEFLRNITSRNLHQIHSV